MEYCRTEIVEPYGIRKVSVYAEGGRERYESVWNALKAIAPASDRQYVFIHDGARPFVTPEIIGRAYKAVQKWKACVVGMPVKDTIQGDGRGRGHSVQPGPPFGVDGPDAPGF